MDQIEPGLADTDVQPSATTPESRTLYLVDGSGYIFRAFHALPPLTRSDGTPVKDYSLAGSSASISTLIDCGAAIRDTSNPFN